MRQPNHALSLANANPASHVVVTEEYAIVWKSPLSKSSERLLERNRFVPVMADTSSETTTTDNDDHDHDHDHDSSSQGSLVDELMLNPSNVSNGFHSCDAKDEYDEDYDDDKEEEEDDDHDDGEVSCDETDTCLLSIDAHIQRRLYQKQGSIDGFGKNIIQCQVVTQLSSNDDPDMSFKTIMSTDQSDFSKLHDTFTYDKGDDDDDEEETGVSGPSGVPQRTDNNKTAISRLSSGRKSPSRARDPGHESLEGYNQVVLQKDFGGPIEADDSNMASCASDDMKPRKIPATALAPKPNVPRKAPRNVPYGKNRPRTQQTTAVSRKPLSSRWRSTQHRPEKNAALGHCSLCPIQELTIPCTSSTAAPNHITVPPPTVEKACRSLAESTGTPSATTGTTDTCSSSTIGPMGGIRHARSAFRMLRGHRSWKNGNTTSRSKVVVDIEAGRQAIVVEEDGKEENDKEDQVKCDTTEQQLDWDIVSIVSVFWLMVLLLTLILLKKE